MFDVKLTKITSTHLNLRTPEIVGECTHLPAKGQPFVMTGQSLTPEGVLRLIITSLVQKTKRLSNKISFATENSTYELEYTRRCK